VRRETEFRWLFTWRREEGKTEGDDVLLCCVATEEEQMNLKYSTWTGETDYTNLLLSWKK
jgi:hypothetical protein